jgi:hypothetical protein
MSAIPRAPKTARVSARAYPHKYILTAASAADAEEFARRVLAVGMGAVALVRSGRTLTFRTAEPLDLPENGGRPGVSRDAIVRLSHAFDAELRPEALYQIVVQTKRGPLSWHPYVSRDEALRVLPQKQRLAIAGVIKDTWEIVPFTGPPGALPNLGDEGALRTVAPAVRRRWAEMVAGASAATAQPTTFEAAVPQLVSALRRAAEEHGRPNTFGAGELREYGGPPAMIAGRIGKRFDLMQRVWALLGHREGWGSCPRYDKGRFAV